MQTTKVIEGIDVSTGEKAGSSRNATETNRFSENDKEREENRRGEKDRATVDIFGSLQNDKGREEKKFGRERRWWQKISMDFLTRATGTGEGVEVIPEEPEYLCRYSTVKHSWRGRYKRVFCVSQTAIITLDPITLICTNCYDLVKDLEGISVAHGKEEIQGSEFSISVRSDGRGKFKFIKFSCRYRTALITDLYKAIGALHDAPPPPPPPEFSVLHYRRRFGTYGPYKLRVTRIGVEIVELTSGRIHWGLEFQHMDDPGIILLHDSQKKKGLSETSGFVLCPLYGRKQKAFMVGPGTTNSTVVSKIVETAKLHLGFVVNVDSRQKLEIDEFVKRRGKIPQKR